MKKPRFVIFHGTGGNPNENWFPWLRNQLASKGFQVDVPTFPTPEGQTLTNWKAAFLNQIASVTDNMILIGHSMGVGMILRVLEETEQSVQAVFLVSGWDGLLGSSEFDPLIESFYTKPFDYTRIRQQIRAGFAYHGDDDPYVPLQMAQDLAHNLGIDLTVIPEGGHLNPEQGYLEFPRLLQDLENFVTEVI